VEQTSDVILRWFITLCY